MQLHEAIALITVVLVAAWICFRFVPPKLRLHG